MDIFHDESDMWQFLRMMYYLNDANYLRNWERDLSKEGEKGFRWLESWPKRKELVPVMAFALHKNHFHLILKQTENDGIAKFIKRLAGAYALRYNKKYNASGGLFQGPYRSRLITTDDDLRTVLFYVVVKNTFERYPSGKVEGKRGFDGAYAWALSDSFSSFADYAGSRDSSIINKDILSEMFSSEKEFKEDSYDYFANRQEREVLIKEALLVI